MFFQWDYHRRHPAARLAGLCIHRRWFAADAAVVPSTLYNDVHASDGRAVMLTVRTVCGTSEGSCGGRVETIAVQEYTFEVWVFVVLYNFQT